jgi:oligosaccharide repeat unit polymerase
MNDAYRHFNLDLWRVYEFRRVVGEATRQGLAGYFVSMTSGLALVILAVYYTHKRRWAILALVIAINLLVAGTISHKSAFFQVFFALALYVMIITKRERFIVGILGVMVVGYSMIRNAPLADTIRDMFVRRGLFLPSQTIFVYYETFSDLGFVYMSHSWANPFIEYPFEILPVNLVSMRMFGRADANMNVGFLGTSYMHFGWTGMLIYAVIVGCILIFLDSATYSSRFRPAAMSAMAGSMISLFDSADLTVALLTNGLAFGLLAVWVLAEAERTTYGVVEKYEDRAPHLRP